MDKDSIDEVALAEALEASRGATPAPEPGGARPTTLNEAREAELQSTLETSSSAGYVYIWDTRTGERSLCNNNNLIANLNKKREDGSRVFTVKDPGITPERGSNKCRLHPDGPDRAEYDKMGLAICRKSNLKSAYEVERHMSRRHRQEWEVINQADYARRQAEDRQRADEDRKFQRELLTALIAQNQKGHK